RWPRHRQEPQPQARRAAQLPQRPGRHELLAPVAPRSAGSAAYMSDARRHILIVDDEALWLRSCEALLRQAGYRVTAALGGREGLACLLREDCDLLLLDLNMPQVNGLDVLAWLRDNKR